MPYKNYEGYSKYIKVQQAKRGYPKFPKLENLKYRLGTKRAALKLKIGTLQNKWLQELKQEKDIIILPKFKKRYNKGYYKAALQSYYIKNKPIILIQVY